nr:CHASE2 domain-containing protein [Desulfobulbaceae bacterium]
MLARQTHLRLSHKEVFSSIAIGCFVAAVLGLAGQTQSWPFVSIDNFFQDTFLTQKASHKASDNITIIDIDDVSLEAVGQWPWPRYRIAAFIETISALEPKAIGLDIVFPEPDSSALINIKQTFKNDFNLDISFQGVPSSLTDNDGYLGSVIKNSGTVGANYFYFDYTGSSGSCSGTDFSITGAEKLTLDSARGRLCNTEKISENILFRGFINCQTDKDGMLRQLPLLIEYQSSIYPNLTLATLLKGLGESSAQIGQNRNGPYIEAGPHHIPISKTGYAILNFQGPPSLYPTLSAVDVLNKKINPVDIKDKYILIGSSAIGLNDLYPTPFDPLFPGIKTHAVMLESILANKSIHVPSWSQIALPLFTLLSVIIMLLLFTVNSRPFTMVIGSLTLDTI